MIKKNENQIIINRLTGKNISLMDRIIIQSINKYEHKCDFREEEC